MVTAWPTWQEAMKAKTLPHEYVEQIRRKADDIQASKLEFMPRTYLEVLKGKKREIATSRQDENEILMTPQVDKVRTEEDNVLDSGSGSDSSDSDSSIDDMMSTKDKKRKLKRKQNRKEKMTKLKKMLQEANSMLNLTKRAKEDEAREIEVSTSARAELTFTPSPKRIEANMSSREKLKLADQAKKHLEETTGIARINNALIAALSTEFGLAMTTKTKIDSTSQDYGIALFWYMIVNNVEKFSRMQYRNIYKQMTDPDEQQQNPQRIIMWLDRHFKAFEVAKEPIPPAEKTRIFLNMVENQMGKDMLNYIRRLPLDYKLSDEEPDYEIFTKAIVRHVGYEFDFPTPTKRVQIMKTEGEPDAASPEERLSVLEAKLAKMSTPAHGAKQRKDDKVFERWGLRRKQEKTDPPGIWAPDACCAFHLYREGKTTSTTIKSYHTNAQCKVSSGTTKPSKG